MHDMMWIEAPELAASFLPTRAAMHCWYRFHFSHSISQSKRIIAISKSTANAIAKIYPAHAHKIRVIKHGLDLTRFHNTKIPKRDILARWVPLNSPFAIAVGQGSPYKNHANIVRAYLHATADLPDHRLVLVRRFVRWDSEMRSVLAIPQARRRVLVYPFVPSEVLMGLYGHAQMLLFASHYEGCGMPAMEAMALGIPVVASTAPALVEMTGDAALHADPCDVSDIASKIRALIDDEYLRNRLVTAGQQLARTFSWKQAAEKTLKVYREAVQ